MNATLQVEGMTCGHCVETVRNAVSKLRGVSNVLVDLEGKTVEVDFDEGQVEVDEISHEIQVVGFKVVAAD